MKKKNIAILVLAIVLISVVAAVLFFLNQNKVSKTELAATIVYSDETDAENKVYYRILKTTYYRAGDPTAGLNTEALRILFPIDQMDSCEHMMIQDWCAALYKKDDTAYLCWTYDPELTYVLEYTPSKIPDTEIMKMAESAWINENAK